MDERACFGISLEIANQQCKLPWCGGWVGIGELFTARRLDGTHLQKATVFVALFLVLRFGRRMPEREKFFGLPLTVSNMLTKAEYVGVDRLS